MSRGCQAQVRGQESVECEPGSRRPRWAPPQRGPVFFAGSKGPAFPTVDAQCGFPARVPDMCPGTRRPGTRSGRA